MNSKKIVTTLVLGFVLCFTLALPANAAVSVKSSTKVAVTKETKSTKKNKKKLIEKKNTKKIQKDKIASDKKKQKKASQTNKAKSNKSKSSEKNQSKLLPNDKKKYSEQDLRLMANIIFCEAGNQSYAGKKAVGIVVMNRVRSHKFPNTITKVIYQKSQFGPASNGSLNRAFTQYDKGNFTSAAHLQCIEAAKETLEGSTIVKLNGTDVEMKTYLFFSGYVSGARLQIGGHQFK